MGGVQCDRLSYMDSAEAGERGPQQCGHCAHHNNNDEDDEDDEGYGDGDVSKLDDVGSKDGCFRLEQLLWY
jgi:hypothetical protein